MNKVKRKEEGEKISAQTELYSRRDRILIVNN